MASKSELNELKKAVSEAKKAYYKGMINLEAAYSICDIYIEYFEKYKRDNKLKIAVPNRHRLMW